MNSFSYRMKLCYLLPKVKSTLKVPTDKHLLQQLELCIRKLLCQEKDKDVLTIVKRVSIFLIKEHLMLQLSLQIKTIDVFALEVGIGGQGLCYSFCQFEQLESEKMSD